MRRIIRPSKLPSFFHASEVTDEKSRILRYLRQSPEYRRSRRDNLNESLFYDYTLLESLRDVFGGKCAFCESRSHDEGYSDGSGFQALHLRPLRFVEETSFVKRDYYLWLAFEWRNIYLACSYCAKAKGNRFPVQANRAPLLASYIDTKRKEKSLVVDPCNDDPRKHLKFRLDGRVEGITNEGHATITVFDLNRSELRESRRHAISEMLRSLQHVTADGALLDQALAPNAQHSGATAMTLRRLCDFWGIVPQSVMKESPKYFGYAFARFLADVAPQDRARLNHLINELEEQDIVEPLEEAPLPRNQSFPLSEERNLDALFFARDTEIKSINIHNYKVFDALQLKLQSSRKERSGVPCLMILGENSTGKSSILAATALALVGGREARKLSKYLPALPRSENRTRLDQMDEPLVEATVNFHFSKENAHFRYDPLTDTVDGGDPATVVLGYGPRRFFHPRKLEYKGGAAARIKTLFDPLATIPYPDDWLWRLNDEQFDNIAAALRIVLAMDDEDELIRSSDGGILVRANGRSTPIDALSEGYRSTFTMTVDMLREFSRYWRNVEQAQGVVLIDEIETHLHPRWKMQVMSSLRRVLPRVQFIVTTHDPLCLRGMDDGEVVVLQRDEDHRVRELQNLPSVRGMTAEQLLTSDYFGLASTADPGLELGLLKAAGDYVRRTEGGGIAVDLSEGTKRMIDRMSLGDTPTEQIMQQALKGFLEAREASDARPRSALRAEAVQAVIAALKESR
ncbi:AAA family ATPase [Ensifer sp. SL37]|uniref:AAA family ATPase n=1 Tax=Ensifer sp. SL37 TaxID=2995137 RepID=UPI002276A6FC|nr:AAA family ATPase [Ensifer sp. SL37]MCY1744550.1 AAA family ATPase [Ensifer sp. SL37]